MKIRILVSLIAAGLTWLFLKDSPWVIWYNLIAFGVVYWYWSKIPAR